MIQQTIQQILGFNCIQITFHYLELLAIDLYLQCRFRKFIISIKEKQKMAWYFNFCAPHLPNDPTINFHRYVQAALLLFFLLICSLVYIYYKLYGPDPKDEKQVKSSSEGSDPQSNKEKQSEQNSQHHHHEEEKSVSIAGGSAADYNSSYVTFKTSEKNKKKKKKQEQVEEQKKKEKIFYSQKVNFEEIESYFPIVFGHFSLGAAFTIMYSPYAQQSIAIIVYILLSFLLLFVNAKRKIKTTRVIWGVMIVIICFLLMSGLLEVGQANFNKIDKECFSVGYQSLY